MNMERRGGSKEEERGESSTISVNEEKDEGLGLLKKEIASHSLYGLLVKSHLDCLKLCLGNMDSGTDDPTALSNIPNLHPNLFRADPSELDQFMEAFCMTLNKVKEVIEEPQQESMAFISYMYSQLEELLAEIPSSSTLSALSSSRSS